MYKMEEGRAFSSNFVHCNDGTLGGNSRNKPSLRGEGGAVACERVVSEYATRLNQ